jgi:hypothetical protein
MATSLVTPLPTIHRVYNPLIVTLSDSADPASGREGKSAVEVLLEIEDELNSNEWRLIAEYLNPYDYTTDQATVTLHKALQGALGANPEPILSSYLQEIPGIVKRYRLKVRDQVDGIPVGNFATLSPAYAWQAGNRGTLADSYDPLNGKAYLFLSKLPSVRRVAPKEKIAIQFLSLQTVSGVDLEVTATQPDGTVAVSTYDVGNVSAYRCYSFSIPSPEGFAVLPTKIVVKLIGGFSGSQPTITYLVTQNPTPWGETIYLKNSFGGWDHIYCSGKNQKTVNLSSEIFEAQEHPLQAGQLGNSKAYNQRGNEGFVFRTGYMNADEQKSLVDLLLRNEAWHYYNTKLWPMIITNKSIREKADGENLYFAEITAQYAFDHHAY